MGDMDDGFEDEHCKPLASKRHRQRRTPPDGRLPTMNELVKGVQATRDATEEDALLAVVEDYLGDEVFARRFVECMAIIRRKNADYSQGEQKQDRIAAFKRIARDIDVPVRKAWAVFAQKHWGAVMRYVKDGFLESEPIDGRINDLINYLVLLGAIVDWEDSMPWDGMLKEEAGG